MIENDDLERAVGELAAWSRRLVARGYHVPTVIQPRVDDLLEHVDSRYALVIVSASAPARSSSITTSSAKARSTRAPPPLVESRSKNYLTMALEETVQGKIKYTYKG